MVGSDFCSTPDESVISLITGFQGKLSPFVSTLMVYYVTGCLPERQPLTLATLSSAVSSVGGVLHSQLLTVAHFTQETGLAEQCGGEAGPSKLVALLDLTDMAIHGMYDILFGLRDILQCNNFNPIYTTLVYDAMCNNAVTGLSWIFFTSFFVATFSLSMVTLRAAIHQYWKEDIWATASPSSEELHDYEPKLPSLFCSLAWMMKSVLLHCLEWASVHLLLSSTVKVWLLSSGGRMFRILQNLITLVVFINLPNALVFGSHHTIDW